MSILQCCGYPISIQLLVKVLPESNISPLNNISISIQLLVKVLPGADIQFTKLSTGFQYNFLLRFYFVLAFEVLNLI